MAIELFAKDFKGCAAEGVLSRFSVARETGVLDQPDEDDDAVFFDVTVCGISTAVADGVAAGLKSEKENAMSGWMWFSRINAVASVAMRNLLRVNRSDFSRLRSWREIGLGSYWSIRCIEVLDFTASSHAA